MRFWGRIYLCTKDRMLTLKQVCLSSAGGLEEEA
jgi:hypothetical protein